jgi:hypothetical protein
MTTDQVQLGKKAALNLLRIADDTEQAWRRHNARPVSAITEFSSGMMRGYAAVLANIYGCGVVEMERRLRSGKPLNEPAP